MTLDHEIRDAFRTAGPSTADLVGDVARVRRTVRGRRVRRRVGVGLALGTVVVMGGLVVVGDDGDSGRVIVDEPPSSATTRPGPSTTDRDSDGGTTTTSSVPSTSTTSATTTTTTATPGPQPTPIEDVDFGSFTYPGACAPFDDRAITLENGQATIPLNEGGSLRPELVAAATDADADGDGDADAVVLIHCTFAGASTDSSMWAAAYRMGADGQPELYGTPLVVEHPQDMSAPGQLRAQVTADIYDADDAACCPSARVEQMWVFDGGSFRLESERPLDPPSAG